MKSTYQNKARNLRRMSIVYFAVAGFFATAGVVIWAATGNALPNAISILCAFIMAASGVSLRGTANRYDAMARWRF